MALKPAGLLQPLPIPEITMDFITGLPTANNKSVIVVVVHRLSKYCHLGALTANYTPVTVAEFFQITWHSKDGYFGSGSSISKPILERDLDQKWNNVADVNDVSSANRDRQ